MESKKEYEWEECSGHNGSLSRDVTTNILAYLKPGCLFVCVHSSCKYLKRVRDYVRQVLEHYMVSVTAFALHWVSWAVFLTPLGNRWLYGITLASWGIQLAPHVSKQSSCTWCTSTQNATQTDKEMGLEVALKSQPYLSL